MVYSPPPSAEVNSKWSNTSTHPTYIPFMMSTATALHFYLFRGLECNCQIGLTDYLNMQQHNQRCVQNKELFHHSTVLMIN